MHTIENQTIEEFYGTQWNVAFLFAETFHSRSINILLSNVSRSLVNIHKQSIFRARFMSNKQPSLRQNLCEKKSESNCFTLVWGKSMKTR